MENHAANPAGRLWLYFTEMTSSPANGGLNNYAAAYFQTRGISALYMKSMAGLMQLPDEVEAMVAQIESPPIPVEKLVRPLGKVREYFNGDPLGANPTKWMSSFVDIGVLNDLETTSHILNSSVVRSNEIDQDTLEQIKSLAADIIDLATADESLDSDARAAFIRYAHRIAEAADLYKVRGPQGLVDELDRFHQSARRLKTKPSPTLWEKTKQLTGVVVLAVELFGAPATVDNAIEHYGDLFTQQAITEAPGPQHADDIVEAEVVEDDGAA
ncbi:hypothetical protein [Microbacterium sp. 5K110]|jgi:hypothetical protein|uniref:hypothetical protein n=1 Tax=unclassified Microbacterium TaxID=2609290 RepID=UPI0010FCEBE4|nr:hypothetical protein [Microbacterium sp. 5K110]TLF31052.1 hypothetical protein FE256_08865 [Microbacterium sp. 5K110]